ncbi:PAP2 family protein [Leishmania donovani]|uniref:PAP2 family protein n=1 Tax=Leishmania donovani TaxID=5661 RepID=A0A504XZE1_LEIDO|nr:PAP2 family protein [Leishmania donovani]
MASCTVVALWRFIIFFRLHDYVLCLICGLVALGMSKVHPHCRPFSWTDPSINFPYAGAGTFPSWTLPIISILPVVVYILGEAARHLWLGRRRGAIMAREPCNQQKWLTMQGQRDGGGGAAQNAGEGQSCCDSTSPLTFPSQSVQSALPAGRQGEIEVLVNSAPLSANVETREAQVGSSTVTTALSNCQPGSLRTPLANTHDEHTGNLAFALLVVNAIKVYAGRLRPDFLSRLRNEGYSPQSTGIDLCTAFRRSGVSLWRIFMGLLPLTLPIVVAVSRTRDNRHYFDDILAGSAIGIVSAVIAVSAIMVADARTGHLVPRILYPSGDACHRQLSSGAAFLNLKASMGTATPATTTETMMILKRPPHHFYLWRVPDYLAIVIIAVVAAVVGTKAQPHCRDVDWSDPAIGHPFATKEVFPTYSLVIASFVVMIYFAGELLTRWSRPAGKLNMWLHVNGWVLTQTWSITLTFAVVSLSKLYAGRLRPDFLSRLASEGITETSWATMTHDSQCRAAREGRLSFPSGHSSTAFSGYVPPCMYLMGLFRTLRGGRLWLVTLLLLPLILPITIAISRTTDYRHNFDDILAGSICGSALGVLSVVISFRPSMRGEWTLYDHPDDNVETQALLMRPVTEGGEALTGIAAPSPRNKHASGASALSDDEAHSCRSFASGVQPSEVNFGEQDFGFSRERLSTAAANELPPLNNRPSPSRRRKSAGENPVVVPVSPNGTDYGKRLERKQ